MSCPVTYWCRGCVHLGSVLETEAAVLWPEFSVEVRIHCRRQAKSRLVVGRDGTMETEPQGAQSRFLTLLVSARWWCSGMATVSSRKGPCLLLALWGLAAAACGEEHRVTEGGRTWVPGVCVQGKHGLRDPESLLEQDLGGAQKEVQSGIQ